MKLKSSLNDHASYHRLMTMPAMLPSRLTIARIELTAMPDNDDLDATNLASLPVLRSHEEQRQLPIVSLRTAAEITTTGQHKVRVSTRNLSPDGAQVQCDIATELILRPDGRPIRADNMPSMMLRIMLGRKGFAAIGKLSYLTPRSSDEIAFGVKFIKMHDEHESASAVVLDGSD